MNRNVEALIAPLYLGNGTNRTKVETDGSITFEGDATVWDDVSFPLIASKLDSAAGTLEYNYPNASITMSGGGSLAIPADTLYLTCQIPHRAKLNSTADLHMHWEQPANQAYTFSVSYRIQKNGQAKTTAWSTPSTITMANNVFSYVSGTLIQITRLLNIDLTGIGLSDLIQVKLTRTDLTAGDIEAITLDCHFEMDCLGSRQEYIK